MPRIGTPAQQKRQVFDEAKAGTLHSGRGGPVVTKRKQAIAIALSTERRAKAKQRTKR